MGERPFTVETRVGRLIEARVFGLRSREDAEHYAQEIGVQALRAGDKPQFVLCADHRPVAVYSQPVADRLAELFAHMNDRLERVAIVVARTNATLAMQLERIVREAANPARRVFYLADGAESHLAPVLEPSELSRMRSFLDEYSPRSTPSV